MSYQKLIDKNCEIVFQEDLWLQLSQALTEINPSQIFVLTDTNTERDCLPFFTTKFPKNLTYKQICIPAGEIHKNLDTCTQVWQALSDAGADRKSLLINLGGGMVCDLGGFVASTYMRAIQWINIPTSLLSMVDASVGGKTGIDFNGLKNLIGVIRNPYLVGIAPIFLKTLSLKERYSGFAEMLKHALLTDKEYWMALENLDLASIDSIKEQIYTSIRIKHAIVSQDRDESGIRKQLNLGHTIGHAIESYFLQKQEPILHGEAVAAGILMELYLSKAFLGFSEATFHNVEKFILNTYAKLPIREADLDGIINNLAFDKKNEKGKINFVLLRRFGEPEIDYQVPDRSIVEAIQYYKKV